LPEGAITIPDIYEYLNTIDSEKMALLYSAADVLLLPSRAEGFGVPLIEAQACGCPVITSDFGPMRELCMSGWLVDGQRDWDQGLQQWQFLPFSHSILSSLEQAYQGKVSGKNAQMRNHASVMAKEYDVEVVTREYLVPVLESLEEAVGGVGSLDILQEL
jgi:glycosyltransferase involved in cell wall biosynthesis